MHVAQMYRQVAQLPAGARRYFGIEIGNCDEFGKGTGIAFVRVKKLAGHHGSTIARSLECRSRTRELAKARDVRGALTGARRVST